MSSLNIVKIKDLVFVDLGDKLKDLVLVFDFFEHDLFGIARRGRKWNMSEVSTIFKQICKGLADLHRARIVHRDLKTANLLINSRGEV